MSRSKEILLVCFVAATILFTNLGAAKLWDRDEPRNAGCALEMMQSGDLITPMFNDEMRDAKPVLQYWFIISAYKIFGITEFAARFWSAVFGMGTVLSTYFIGQRLFNRQVGVFAAIALSTSFMFVVASRAATPDSFLIFFSTASIAVFVGATFPRNSECITRLDERLSTDLQTQNESDNTPEQGHGGNESFKWPQPLFPTFWYAVLMYGLMAIGVLAKGPIGFLMPTAIIGMYLLICRQRFELGQCNQNADFKPAPNNAFVSMITCIAKTIHPWHFLKTCWSMRLLTATCVVLAIAAPWFVLVGLRTDGDFLQGFFVREHLGRSTKSFEGHAGTILYYPIAMLVGLFPWSVFAGPILFSIWKIRKRFSPEHILLFCWIGVQVGLFSIVKTKLPSYVSPCYPAAALLTGYFVHAWVHSTVEIPNWFPRLSFATLAIAGLMTVAGIGYVAIEILQIEILIAFVGLIPLLFGILGFSYWAREAKMSTSGNAISGFRPDTNQSKGKQTAMQFTFAGAVLFSLVFFALVLPRVSKAQRCDALLASIRQDDAPLGAYKCLEPTWVYYGREPIYELCEVASDVELAGRKKKWKKKPLPGLLQFLTDNSGQVITTIDRLPEVEKIVGKKVAIIDRIDYFLQKDEELVVIKLATNQISVESADSSSVANKKTSGSTTRR